MPSARSNDDHVPRWKWLHMHVCPSLAACRLANLERFTKRQQSVSAPAGTQPHVDRLLKEESYLKSRLLFVQQVRATRAASASALLSSTSPPATHRSSRTRVAPRPKAHRTPRIGLSSRPYPSDLSLAATAGTISHGRDAARGGGRAASRLSLKYI